MQTTAIILAGGKSKRMGTDKALLEIDGISLLKRSITLCKTVCTDIIISSNNSKHQYFGYPVVADEIENCGPICGILSCLKKTKTEWNLLISVDAAFVEPDFLNFLISEVGDYDAVVPFSAKGKEPLIALYNKKCVSAVEEQIHLGDFKIQNLISLINTKWLDVQSWLGKYPRLFHNINRPEDL